MAVDSDDQDWLKPTTRDLDLGSRADIGLPGTGRGLHPMPADRVIKASGVKRLQIREEVRFIFFHVGIIVRGVGLASRRTIILVEPLEPGCIEQPCIFLEGATGDGVRS